VKARNLVALPVHGPFECQPAKTLDASGCLIRLPGGEVVSQRGGFPDHGVIFQGDLEGKLPHDAMRHQRPQPLKLRLT
jgi:hypothetical protein